MLPQLVTQTVDGPDGGFVIADQPALAHDPDSVEIVPATTAAAASGSSSSSASVS